MNKSTKKKRKTIVNIGQKKSVSIWKKRIVNHIKVYFPFNLKKHLPQHNRITTTTSLSEVRWVLLLVFLAWVACSYGPSRASSKNVPETKSNGERPKYSMSKKHINSENECFA